MRESTLPLLGLVLLSACRSRDALSDILKQDRIATPALAPKIEHATSRGVARGCNCPMRAATVWPNKPHNRDFGSRGWRTRGNAQAIRRTRDQHLDRSERIGGDAYPRTCASRPLVWHRNLLLMG
jgi:hypothetical protein